MTAAKPAAADHDEADEGHHAHTLGEGILALAEFDDATAGEDDEACERPQHDAVGHQLQAECHGDGQQGYPDVVEIELDRLGFGGQDLLQIILTRLAVAEEDGDEQAEEHAEYRDGHRQGQLAEFHRYAVVDEILGQDVVQEDTAKADRQQHVGSGQAEGDDAGHLTAVDLHLGHDMQQRRIRMGMKAMCTGIRFWEETETASTEVSSRLLTQRMRVLLASLPSWLMTLRGQQIRDAGAGDGYRESPSMA